jgi:UDP-glucose:(heptosyl)LPS alpha-1,3-glucosyltransferase
MRSLHHVPAERIRVVHNGVDLSRFGTIALGDARPAIRRHYGVRDDEVLLIAVAHHFRLKGIPGLIRAVDHLRREGNPARLLLCGGPSSSANSGAVLECGRVEDVAPFYAAADICVHPTFYDACSLVTFEAMAAGLPVVTTRANGACELITHGIDGLVLDLPHDSSDLVAALRPLVRHENLRHELGSAGRRLVQARSVEKNYHAIAAAYADALALRSADAAEIEPLLIAADQPQTGNRFPSKVFQRPPATLSDNMYSIQGTRRRGLSTDPSKANIGPLSMRFKPE